MSQELPDGVELPELPPKRKMTKLLDGYLIEIEAYGNPEMHAYARSAILADREKQAARVPEGWKLVPVAHTKSMQAIFEAIQDDAYGSYQEMWNDLLAAAPTTEPSKAEQAEAPRSGCCHGIIGYCTKCNEKKALREAATQPPASNAGEREEFEAHALSDKHDVTRMLANPEIYDCNYTQVIWEGWQLKARAALATKPQAGQKPAFWAPPRYDGEWTPFDGETVYRTEKAGWVPLYYAAPQAGDVAQDKEHAENYRLIRRGQHWSVVDGIGNTLRGDDLDAAVDAIRAARAARTRGEGGGT